MLGDKIRQHRKLNHLSQEELAEKLGVSRQSISLWENNQTQPTIENVVVLAKLFGVSTDELLSGNAVNAFSRPVVEPIFEPTPTEVPSATQSAVLQTAEPTVSAQGDKIHETEQPQKNKAKPIGAIIAIIVVSVLAVVAFLISKGHNANGDAPLSAEEIYTQIFPSVVEIEAESSTFVSTGTGFFFDENGTVITNYHVIEDCQSAEITLSDGATYTVTAVLGWDSNKDIAILATNCKTSIPLSIRSTPVKTGETVYALGSSLGLTGSLSDGIISAVDREVGGNAYIQTTAPISQGNSGGPLVDSKGAVVGIVCASISEGQNLNLAIPIAEINGISQDNKMTLQQLFPQAKQEVEWISDWRFLYYAEEDTYVLLFQLSDKDEVPMSATGVVDIRIVNDENVTVYEKTHNFSPADFEEWIYDDTDEMYLATIYISPQSIAKGSTEFGTVYFEVLGMTYGFDETSIEVFDLPTSSSSASNTPPQEGATPSPTTPPPATTTPGKYTCLEYFCNNTVSNDGDYCSEHRCANSWCPYSKGSNSNYCSVCACFSVGCKNGKIENGYYCKEHTCAASGCTSEKSQSSDYCFLHQSNSSQSTTPPATSTLPTTQPTPYTCLERTCDNVVSNNGEYCSEHKCANNGCSYEKEYNSDYCSVCTCSTTGCTNVKRGDGYYCTEHTCAASGCTSEKSYGKNYCFHHTCASCDNIVIDGGFYCVDHTCVKHGCTSTRAPSSQYCTSHQCMAGTCKNGSIDGGDYCEEHTCIVEGCTKQKLTSDYCYSHSP